MRRRKRKKTLSRLSQCNLGVRKFASSGGSKLCLATDVLQPLRPAVQRMRKKSGCPYG